MYEEESSISNREGNIGSEVNVNISSTEEDTSSFSSIRQSYQMNDSDSDEDEDDLDSYEYSQSQDLLEVRENVILIDFYSRSSICCG